MRKVVHTVLLLMFLTLPWGTLAFAEKVGIVCEDAGYLLFNDEYFKAIDAASLCLSEKGASPDARAESLIVRSRAYLGISRQDKAIVDIENAIALQPDNVWAHETRVAIYESLNYAKETIEALGALARLDSENAVEHYERRLDLRMREAEFGPFPDLLGAIADLTELMKLQPEKTRSYLYMRSDLHLVADRFAEAVEDYSKCLELYQDWSEHGLMIIYSQRAWAKMMSGDYPGGVEDYRRAIKIQPGNETLYNELGMFHENNNNYVDASANYNMATCLSSAPIGHYRMDLCNMYYRLGDYEWAATCYSSVLNDSDQEYAMDAYMGRAKAYRDLGFLSRAERDFRKILQEYDSSCEAYIGLGSVLEQRNEWNEAVRLYEKGLSCEPHRPYMDYLLGAAMYEVKDYVGAIEWLTQSMVPEVDDFIYVARGKALRDSGDLDGALLDFNKAIGMNPEYAEAYAERSYAYTLRGDRKASERDVKKALELDPSVHIPGGSTFNAR